jgi:hypothetical protein
MSYSTKISEAPDVWTVGGESHQFIEGIRQLNPMSGRVDSNRLDASHATDHIIEALHQRFARTLSDRDDRKWIQHRQPEQVRFLEKTPKNALRQPFLDRVFNGALYLYLFRDPRPNLSSMMEAWKSGRWVTYRRLRGWRGPAWSLLLPPGWQALSGHSLAEICAFQWESANRIILDDLEKLAPERWIACNYEDLLTDTEHAVRRICKFAGLEVDQRLQRLISGTLPLSRYTHTAPDPDKWRKNAEEIESVLPSLQSTWERCLKLATA